jgi:hypothetical protein
MARATFEAQVRATGRGGGGHLVEVPPDVIEALGGKGRIPVRATFNGAPYRGSIVRMGGVTMLGVTKAIMAEAGVGVGDMLTVVVDNDEEPRELEVPGDLAKALRRNRMAREAFEALSYSRQRELVGSIIGAKRPQTRTNRVEQAVRTLTEGGDSGRPKA